MKDIILVSMLAAVTAYVDVYQDGKMEDNKSIVVVQYNDTTITRHVSNDDLINTNLVNDIEKEARAYDAKRQRKNK